jgi:NAD(P)-dependent dehydrogenase (short-subunit alcohol dehydrogenase family)
MSDRIATHTLLTGANRGIGLEWTRQLADRVDRLFATCRRPGEAHELHDLADAHPDTIEVFALDVSDPEAIEAAADRVNTETDALDLLVNNAGVNGGGTGDRFGTVDQETMMDVFRVNTAGPHLMTQAFADLLRSNGTADDSIVVNVTSQLGSIANTNGGGWHSYKASKAALNMCTRLQAGALKGDGVIVVSMHPGWVRTDMGGANARLSTEESVTGMLDVIADLTPDDSGRFLSFDGRDLPW